MTLLNRRPLALIILDGWGVGPTDGGNAILRAHTPSYDALRARYPGTTLAAAGTRVGLTAGSPGNAEAGHLNIGAGRVMQTDVSRIADAVRSGRFFENAVLKEAIAGAARDAEPLHLIGLLSDAEVHSSLENLYALLRMARKEGVLEVYIHAILDGRDVPPRTADVYIEALEIKMADIGIGRIATVCGRFFAMDSSENWERTARAFTMLVHGEGERVGDAGTAVRNSFLRGISDEFIAPIVIEDKDGGPLAVIGDGSRVIFFNHRADTMRQLVRFLAVPEHSTRSAKPNIHAVCLTDYDESFGLPAAFGPEAAENVLAGVLNSNEIANYRIAEPERFRHITNFFNGRKSASHSYEQHIIVQSAKRPDRENEPELESFKVTDNMLRAMEADPTGVFVINLPASDIVAETGDLEKTIEAVQFVDTCLGGMVEKIRAAGGVALITSSHGNCEQMIYPGSGEPNRFSTSNNVPFHLVDDSSPNISLRPDGSLSDIAPTILGIMGIKAPEEMTGLDLRSK